MGALYHASANKNLEVLEPQRTLSKNKYIGDYVFATADRVLAVMYLIPKGYGSIMDSASKPPKILICADEVELRSKDTGGAIYTLAGADFEESPQLELKAYERASKKPVTPLSKEVFDSVFEAWQKFGIVPKFIDQPTFDRLAKP